MLSKRSQIQKVKGLIFSLICGSREEKGNERCGSQGGAHENSREISRGEKRDQGKGRGKGKAKKCAPIYSFQNKIGREKIETIV